MYGLRVTLLWVTLLLLHQGYSLVPVITVQLDEPVTFTCVLPADGLSSKQLFWFKQKVGDNLKLIATIKKFAQPQYGSDFSASRLEITSNQDLSKLTILRTVQGDEGMYHCAVVDWISTWNGTYLLLKGNTQRTSNYTVAQWSTASDPVRPGDSVSLQCSVLSDSESKTCPGDHSVYWFRAGSDKSHPDIVYTDGNHQCEKRSDTVKSCVYGFSKTINSSDAGTYYCAVATCGQILFGNGTKLDIEQKGNSIFIALIITAVCLAISVTGNIFFICYRTLPVCAQCKESAYSQERHGNSSEPKYNIAESELDLNYAALRFSGGKATKGRKKKELKTEESVYAQVKCST